MTDLEVTKLCAKAAELGFEPDNNGHYFDEEGSSRSYWPLTNEEQAGALVDWLIERGELTFGRAPGTTKRSAMWFLPWGKDGGAYLWFTPDKESRRRGICECVVKIYRE